MKRLRYTETQNERATRVEEALRRLTEETKKARAGNAADFRQSEIEGAVSYGKALGETETVAERINGIEQARLEEEHGKEVVGGAVKEIEDTIIKKTPIENVEELDLLEKKEKWLMLLRMKSH